MALTPDEQQELARLEAAFEELGGRGVELAERIDELRRKDMTVVNYGVSPNWPHWEEPEPDDTVTVTLDHREFLLTRSDALELGRYLRDVVGTKEVLR